DGDHTMASGDQLPAQAALARAEVNRQPPWWRYELVEPSPVEAPVRVVARPRPAHPGAGVLLPGPPQGRRRLHGVACSFSVSCHDQQSAARRDGTTTAGPPPALRRAVSTRVR